MKIIRASPHTDDEADLVDALVHGWCAFDGASQEVWDSFGDEREEVAETTGSALEVSYQSPFERTLPGWTSELTRSASDRLAIKTLPLAAPHPTPHLANLHRTPHLPAYFASIAHIRFVRLGANEEAETGEPFSTYQSEARRDSIAGYFQRICR